MKFVPIFERFPSLAWLLLMDSHRPIEATIMFSPELSQHWFPDLQPGSTPPAPAKREDEPLTPSVREALEALVDRINAARSVL